MCDPTAGIGLCKCGPAAGFGLSEAVLMVATTKTGRRAAGTLVTLGALYASTQIMVTAPLIIFIAPAAVAIALAVVSLLYRQRAMASAAAGEAARHKLADAEQTILALRYELRGPAVVHAERVPELEAARPAVDALPAVVVREDA